jgi:hypothetical protein
MLLSKSTSAFFLSPRKVLLIGDAPAAEINFQSLGSLDFDAKNATPTCDV